MHAHRRRPENGHFDNAHAGKQASIRRLILQIRSHGFPSIAARPADGYNLFT
jgi:hypothetical protein